MPKHDDNRDHKPHFQSHDNFNGKLMPMLDRELKHLYVHQVVWRGMCCDTDSAGVFGFVSPVVHDEAMLTTEPLCPICGGPVETDIEITIIPIDGSESEPPIMPASPLLQ
jgi:hypothetical protein